MECRLDAFEFSVWGVGALGFRCRPDRFDGVKQGKRKVATLGGR